MKIRVINFKKEKIENCYNYNIVSIKLPNNWIDLSLDKQNEWYLKNKNYINQLECSNICITIQYTGDDEFDQYEQMQIISKIAECTITNESTNKGYLFIPLWFGKHVFSSVDIQKKLGNFKNKFEKLQIELYYNDEILERLVE